MVFGNLRSMNKQIVKWIRNGVVGICSTLLLTPLWLGKEHKGKKPPRVHTTGYDDEGTASYYASKFEGRKTASGEVFDNGDMTAAHNTLPLGSLVRVTNLRNGRSVIVKITDRLHANNRRIIDLTQSAARQLGFLAHGLAKVRVELV